MEDPNPTLMVVDDDRLVLATLVAGLKQAGFDVIEANIVPGNAENLIGFAVHPSAMAIAIRTSWGPSWIRPTGCRT